jgi:hypothetical protein
LTHVISVSTGKSRETNGQGTGRVAGKRNGRGRGTCSAANETNPTK